MKRKLKIFPLLFALLFAASALAQQPFKGRFFCDDTKITLTLDLYQESLEAPGLGFLGKVHGYMSGRGVYGTWLVNSFKINAQTATLRLSNDIGSDSQTVVLTLQGDSLMTYETREGNHIRKAQGRKLVKVADRMTFRRAQ